MGENVSAFSLPISTLCLNEWHLAFMDAQGQELFEIHNEIMHLHTTFVARQTGTKRELFRVVEKIMTFHDDMTVYVPSPTLLTMGPDTVYSKLWNEATDRHEELVVRGDWLDRSAEIRLGRGGAILASISRNYWTMKQFLTDASTYAIHIAPGGKHLLRSHPRLSQLIVY
jgi:uncharacterized protein YxjI